MFEKRGMERGLDPQTVHEEKVHAGKRNYFVAVKLTNGGEPYISLKENKKSADGRVENRRILIYPEDSAKIIRAIERADEKMRELKPNLREHHREE